MVKQERLKFLQFKRSNGVVFTKLRRLYANTVKKSMNALKKQKKQIFFQLINQKSQIIIVKLMKPLYHCKSILYQLRQME